MRGVIGHDVSGDGPPVVFLHGLTSSRRSWDPVTALLADEFTCVRVDLRGHGETPPADDYSFPALAGDVRAVVDELGLGEPAVVGHSLGAAVAAVYAAAYGARAVVCVDSSLRLGDFTALVQEHAEGLRGERTMEEVWAIDEELGLGRYAGIDDMRRRILAFPREVVLGVWAGALTTPPEQATAAAEAFLPRIEAPLLALHGSPPPPDYEDWLTGLVPRARVEVWEGAGHMLHLVDPARFAARVRELVSSPRTPTRAPGP
jgi:pimeloyl-ACP methyl ester carboxylesterase